MELIKKIENEQLREDNPDFRVGDTVRVSYRIKEGEKEIADLALELKIEPARVKERISELQEVNPMLGLLLW